MIDVNNSQDFDAETFAEELEEERQKRRNLASLSTKRRPNEAAPR